MFLCFLSLAGIQEADVLGSELPGRADLVNVPRVHNIRGQLHLLIKCSGSCDRWEKGGAAPFYIPLQWLESCKKCPSGLASMLYIALQTTLAPRVDASLS